MLPISALEGADSQGGLCRCDRRKADDRRGGGETGPNAPGLYQNSRTYIETYKAYTDISGRK